MARVRQVYAGSYSLGGRIIRHRTGTAVTEAPTGALVLTVPLVRVRQLADARAEVPGGATTLAADAADAAAAGEEQRAALAGVSYVSVLALHRPRRRTAGWLLLMSDTSCLDDDMRRLETARAYTGAASAKRDCRFVLSSLLRDLLRRPSSRAADDASVDERPALLVHAHQLRRAMGASGGGALRSGRGGGSSSRPPHPSDEANASDADERLNALQVRAYRTQSRVLALVTGCVSGAAECAQPLVAPPRWVDALALTGGDASEGPADDGSLGGSSSSSSSSSTLLDNASEETEDVGMLPRALWVHAAVGIVCVLAVWWRVLGCRRWCGRSAGKRSRRRAPGSA